MSKREKRIMGFGSNPRQINSKKRGTKSVVNHGTIHYAGTAILRLKMQEGKLFKINVPGTSQEVQESGLGEEKDNNNTSAFSVVKFI